VKVVALAAAIVTLEPNVLVYAAATVPDEDVSVKTEVLEPM